MKRLFTTNYDIQGAESLRVSKTYFMSRFIPLGSFGTGPDLRCLLVITVLHYFSRPVFWLLVRREQTMLRIFNKFRRIVSR